MEDVRIAAGSVYPGAFYTPGPTCRLFIESDGFRDLCRASNQVGKTLAGARRSSDFSVSHPGSVLAVLVADLENHYAELCSKVWQVIERPALDPATRYIEGKGLFTHGRRAVLFSNGARWLFRSGTGSAHGLEGFSADAGWVDEVPQRGHYGAFVRGVHGPVWATFTPIGRDPRWFRERVEGDPDTGAPALEAWEQFVVILSLVECPWLTQKQIDERIAKTDPYERAQRIYAEWEGPERERVYVSFTDASVLDADPGGSWSLDFAADHGDRAGKQFGVLIASNGGRVVILDECFNATRNSTPDEDARDVLAMLERRGAPYSAVRTWTADSNAALKSGGFKVSQLLSNALAKRLRLSVGPQFGTPNKRGGSVELGERMLNTGFAAGHLFVHRRCRRLIRALYTYGGDKNDPAKDESDAVRYGVVPLLRSLEDPQASGLYIRN